MFNVMKLQSLSVNIRFSLTADIDGRAGLIVPTNRLLTL